MSVIVCFTVNQANNCRTVSTTGLFDKNSCLDTLPNVCLVVVTAFPRLVYFARICKAYRIVLLVHTQTDRQTRATCLLVKYKRVIGTQQVVPAKQTSIGFRLHTLTVTVCRRKHSGVPLTEH